MKHAGRAWRPLVCISLLLGLLLGACGRSSEQRAFPRMIVLGVDGMDPGFVERHWDMLPNLDRLRRQGGFERLATTIPPQSPVAWSTVITGLDSGGHGIFDFVQRDPQTITPYSSMAEVREPGKLLTFGPWVLPLESGSVRSLRRGISFWELLSQRGVPATVTRMPTNFPPVEFSGRSLAGMGTPDMQGGFGTFTYFTSDPDTKARQVPGGNIVSVRMENRRAVLPLEGPVNSFRKTRPKTIALLTVDTDPGSDAARVVVGSDTLVLKKGEWSPWIRVEFPLLGAAKHASGIFRVLLRSVTPFLAVYASPINIDPSRPELPLSTPESYSRTLAEALGPFYTQGIAEDTAAVRTKVLSHEQFMEQAGQVLEESMAMYRYQLDHFRDGLLFYYFSSVDQHSHILWGKYDDELAAIYKRIDDAAGMAMDKLGGDGTLIVMSDHGFSSFNRAVHLNTWLMKEGLLHLIDPTRTGDEELFANVDWSQTQAYALGLNEVYVNLAGREPNGNVTTGEASRALKEHIRDRLRALRDPQTGEAVVEEVYATSEIDSGPLPGYAPDLIVGYRPGYRGSWQTALGAVPSDVLVDNQDAWLADHCIDPRFVPGVFFSNRSPRKTNLHLRDIPVTILKEFGAPVPPAMTGNSVF
jgi:predicted AlkP superfamily phosphohydrolase/phosphomutase